MSAEITAAVTAAKSTIDRLLSNGNTSATSGLGKGEQWDAWAYAEQFSGPEISVNYRREGKEWIYTVTSGNADSAFFSKTGTARTLREARLEALDAVVAGCATQAEKAENIFKEELLKLMQGEDHVDAVNNVLNSNLLPNDMLRRWQDATIERFIRYILGRSGCNAWESWATNKWLTRNDISSFSAETAFIAASHVKHGMSEAAREAARCAVLIVGPRPACQYALVFAQTIASYSESSETERQHQHRDLLALINEM